MLGPNLSGEVKVLRAVAWVLLGLFCLQPVVSCSSLDTEIKTGGKAKSDVLKPDVY